MAPTGAGFFIVSFICANCGTPWGEQMSQAQANKVRSEATS
jgi:hypothetical protein